MGDIAANPVLILDMFAYDCRFSGETNSSRQIELQVFLCNGSTKNVSIHWPIPLPDDINFTVRYFGLTCIDGRMQTALVADCFISKLCNLFMFALKQSWDDGIVSCNLIGHLSLTTNVSLPCAFFVHGHFSLLPGRNRVIILDFQLQKARVIKLNAKDDSIEDRIIPVSHSKNVLLIQQSSKLVNIFRITLNSEQSETCTQLDSFKIPSHFAAKISGAIFPFCGVACNDRNGGNYTNCSLGVITKTGAVFILDSSGRCLRSLHLGNPVAVVSKLVLLPSLEKDLICFCDSLSKVYIIDPESLVLEKIIEKVQNLYIGVFTEVCYFQVLCVIRENEMLERRVVFDNGREIDFNSGICLSKTDSEFSAAIKKQKHISGSDQFFNVVQKRVECVSVALHYLRAKNSVVSAFITKASQKMSYMTSLDESELTASRPGKVDQLQSTAGEPIIIEQLKLAAVSLPSTCDHSESMEIGRIRQPQSIGSSEKEVIFTSGQVFGWADKMVICLEANCYSLSNCSFLLLPLFKLDGNFPFVHQLDLIPASKSDNQAQSRIIISCKFDKFPVLDYYTFKVIYNDGQVISQLASKSYLLTEIQLCRQQLLRLQTEPEVSTGNLPILKRLYFAFELHVTRSHFDLRQLFAAVESCFELSLIDRAKKLFSFSSNFRNCLMHVEKLTDEEATFVCYAQSEVSLSLIKITLIEKYENICCFTFKFI